MSLAIYEAELETCAETGTIDYTRWPSILPPLMDRLGTIAHSEFPIPRPYPSSTQFCHRNDRRIQTTTSINHPRSLQHPQHPRTLPPVPPFPGSNSSRVPDSQAPDSNPSSPKDIDSKEQLPLEVLQLLNQSLNTLRTSFPEKPPHTVQRLSELVLYPRKHYRTLPAWLRALDRVVSVSSGADVFPLSDQPPDIGPTSTNGILNGAEGGGILFANSSNETRNGYDKDSLGSDESLGGALLTPIPWLKDSDLSTSGSSSGTTMSGTFKAEPWQDSAENAVDPDAGVDSEMLPVVEDQMATTAAHAEAIAAVAQEHVGHNVPEREDGAVTQGELIRMEQVAGVVPVPYQVAHAIGDAGIELDLEDEGDVVPHARGPDVVGTIDMGKVEGEERQVRISSPPDEQSRIDVNDGRAVLAAGHQAIEETAGSEEFVKVEKEDVGLESKSGSSDDGDIVLVDADGAIEEDGALGKAATSGEDAAEHAAADATAH